VRIRHNPQTMTNNIIQQDLVLHAIQRADSCPKENIQEIKKQGLKALNKKYNVYKNIVEKDKNTSLEEIKKNSIKEFKLYINLLPA
jgi:hypothetical protein